MMITNLPHEILNLIGFVSGNIVNLSATFTTKQVISAPKYWIEIIEKCASINAAALSN